jgi:hypothetical protein
VRLRPGDESPDGLLFTCMFDMDRLKGDALKAALSHVGTHIADIRSEQSVGNVENPYRLEYHAWQTTVLMEPGSHYLCIAPDRSHVQWQKGSLYLPFDGDQTLAIILSKAFLLAADSKITDSTILRQFGRPRTPAH